MFVTCGKEISVLYVDDMGRHVWFPLEAENALEEPDWLKSINQGLGKYSNGCTPGNGGPMGLGSGT